MDDGEARELRESVETLQQQLARKAREIQIFHTISNEINSTLDLDRIFEIIIGAMDGAFGFRHSMVLVPDEGARRLRVVASCGYQESGVGATVAFGMGPIGVVASKRRIMRMVGIGTQMAYLAAAKKEAERAGHQAEEGVKLPGLPDVRSQVVIPLIAKERLIGIYAVESPDHNAFNALDEQFLTIVGSQIATAIDNASAYRVQTKLTEAYSRFFPREFLGILDKASILDVALGDQVQREMTILFSDIRSFTSLSEKMTPKENFDFINDFLRVIAPLIREHNGFIDKYIGDAIMALFPGPVDDAVLAALSMQARLAEHNQARRAGGSTPIAIGVGIHTGTLMLGIVGSEDRMDGTVIADSVNLAARLEGVTKDFGVSIVISEAVFTRLADPSRFHVRALGAVTVKGKAEQVRIYEVVSS